MALGGGCEVPHPALLGCSQLLLAHVSFGGKSPGSNQAPSMCLPWCFSSLPVAELGLGLMWLVCPGSGRHLWDII